ncbi:MAG TPA: FecR domain-containing protein [Pyrinomonadaceae bacterium]|jgi:hypothetical protein|nr:FecR domain-containing protein [Pyrinomonadaceae bacterium]
MTKKAGRLSLDWWVVQKRMIYIFIGVLALCGAAGGAGLYVWKYGNPFKHVGDNISGPTGARFISFEGDVRVIRSATRESINASSDTQLFPGDTVQTQGDGRARLTLADGSTLVVRPNSTVIVRDNTINESEQKANVHVTVDRGQINVRTEQQPEGTNNVVETPKTQNKLGSQTGASFDVNPDTQTEAIRVQNGEMATTTSNGEQTVVRGGEYVAVNPAGTLSRQRLLDVPTPSEPRDLEKIFAGPNGAASVPLRWQRPAQGAPAYYRVEVATSPFFVQEGRVIERDQLVSTEFSASDLRPGVYYWRVRATAASGQTSDWSEPQKFSVAPRGTGQRVEVADLNAQLVGGNIYLVRGRASPGTSLRSMGRETHANADGSFQLQITVPAGAREIMLEAQDHEGNSNQYKVTL